MQQLIRPLAVLAVCAVLALPRLAAAQATTAIPPAITTPDKVETRIGTLDFKDGMPSKATLDKVYDNLDFTHAFEAFVNTMQGVSIAAIRKGLLSIGVKDNEVIVFSELMDAKSLFLTANADTVYVVGVLDLTKGPMVLEAPPKSLGTIDDLWFRWVIDFGLPGPDRGEGGKYLILPPGYDGPLPEGGFFVARARPPASCGLGRSFLENKSDPKPAAETIRKFTKVYPYEAGGVGTRIAEFLSGKARLGRVTPPPPTVFHEGSGKVMNTIPPNDLSYLRDAQRGRAAGTGHVARPRADGPAGRHRHRQGQAVCARRADEEDPDRSARARQCHLAQPAHESARSELVLLSGFGVVELPVRDRLRVRDADPADHARGRQAVPAHRLPDAGCAHELLLRHHRHHARDGHAPDRHRLAVPFRFDVDANKNYFDGAKTYKVTLPKGIPEANFWSFTLYDNQTRSMLDTPQRYPRAGSQSYPSPAAEAERRRLHDGLLRPDAAGGRQARQLDPDRCPARAGS